MIQVSALVLRRDERSLLQTLGRAGVVHLSRAEAGPDTAPLQSPDRYQELARCEELLRRVEIVRRAAGVADQELAEQPVSSSSLDEVETQLREVEHAWEELSRHRAQLEQRWGQMTTLLDQMAGYDDLKLPLEELGRFAFLHFAIGTIPERNFETLRDSAENNVVFFPLPRRGGRQGMIAVTSRKGRFALDTSLKQAGFRPEKPPVEDGTDVAAFTQQTRTEQARLAQEIEAAGHRQRALAGEVTPVLARLARTIREEQAILDAQQHFAHTDTAVLITGWAPAEQAAMLEEELRRVTGDRCVIRLEPPDHVPIERIPVLMRQPRWLRPFAALVAGYGLPGYRDLQPTLMVAVTYMLMFGVMFGDVGHGLLLALGGLAAMLITRNERTRDVGLLVLMAGVSSMFFGAVYGSYFGIPSLHHLALWHEPLHEPVSLMLATISVGVVIISMGAVLNVINSFRRGEFLSAALDKFGMAGIIFYWGSLVLIVKYTTLSELGLAGITLVLLIALPLLGVTLKEPLQYALSRFAGHHPHSDNIFVAFIESAIEAFEAVLTYLANTISFVRLAAYAMSHAAILMATFAMAEAVADTPGIGGVLYVVIAVIGNAIALILEGVVVAVQVLRLEYYEFFGKFFSGSGLPFKPFSFLGKEKEQS